MATDAPGQDYDEADLTVGEPKTQAAGVTAVAVALKRSVDQMGAVRTARTLSTLNQKHGFDCPGCAWPEKDHRHPAEFCENGAKAVAEEATLRTVGRDFFARHAVDDLAGRSDWWLGQQGRLTEPMVKREGATHYTPISWDDAFDLIATELRALPSPDAATFYTSGRTSNEAAFAYQLLVRAFGTNNLPDCSNMCHESSSSALSETIGLGKATVQFEDLEAAELIVVMGQNPGTNHPRMLTALEAAKRNGAHVVAVNPLPEAGLLRFLNPQSPRGVVGPGTAIADDFLQIRIGGDLALLQAVGKGLLAADDASGGQVLDAAFIAEHTSGIEAYRAHLNTLDDEELRAATGLDAAAIDALVARFVASRRTVICWAMGLTQHKHSVPTIREVVNVLLLQGNLGRLGAGVCPVRGHSNVQGDRTMGIFERMPDAWLDRLAAEFGFDPPRRHGLDSVHSVRAMRDGQVRAFVAMGGNFVRAISDSDVTEAALRRCRLTVQVSTKLNRSHTVCGEIALILPTLGRTDRDVQASGLQKVSVEDTMSKVHASTGVLDPPSPHLLSEVAIICRLGRRLLVDGPQLPWQEFEADYAAIRRRIAAVVPGFEDFEAQLARPAGFTLPHPARERQFRTATGRATFTANPLAYPVVPAGRLLLQSLRSHDQYNTTIYGLDDRYRGVHGGRRVVFVHPDDLAAQGLRDGEVIDLVSEFTDGERRAEAFRVVAYPTARGCVAAYYPETNVLIPLDSVADTSNTPTSKSVVVRLERR